jgi:hypothetical protein
MEKKTEALTVHLSDTLKKQTLALAESQGLTGSEFIGFLISSHLDQKRSEFRLLQQVFDFERTDGGGENC